MIWILIFTLIFSSGTSFVIPNMSKYAKRHIEVKANSMQVVQLIKQDKKHRKTALKHQYSYLKELRKLNYSRTSSQADFEQVFTKMLNEREELQQSDAKLKSETQEFMTPEEWDLIVKDGKKDLAKTIQKKKKAMAKMEKKFNQFEEYVSTIIPDEKRKLGTLEVLNEFENVVKEKLKFYEAYISNENSTIYAYKSSQGDLNEMQKTANQWRTGAFDSYTKTHFKLLELTTEEEWKQMVKKMKKIM